MESAHVSEFSASPCKKSALWFGVGRGLQHNQSFPAGTKVAFFD